jgi:nitrogen fixation/metabolism regulation signal transduction histidine kinase
MFYLVADVTEDLARATAGDPGRAELARMIARNKVVSAAGEALVFLLAQAGLQIAALAVSSFIATRGLDAEFKRMAALIADQERRLEESAALSAWKEIASFLSHQLKNPLAAVDLSASNARLALSRTVRPAEAPDPGRAEGAILGEAISSIQEETARMKALIGRLKSLTSFEQAELREASLADAAREASTRYPASRAVIEIEGDARVPLDFDLVVQAFVNLMDNSAEEAARSGKSPARIRVAVSSDAEAARVEYSDSGSSFDAATASKLGRERFTTKKTGSGLGILFVSRILAIHGGNLEVRAGPGGRFEAGMSFGRSTGAIGGRR